MRLKRTTHVAIGVTPEQFESAIEFYKHILSGRRIDQSPNDIGIQGDNVTIWISRDKPGRIIQEFATDDGEAMKQKLLAADCSLIEVNGTHDSGSGFFVRDPFGLEFHVYTAQDAFLEKTLST